MDHFERDRALLSLTILVDTREQDTPRSRERYAQFNMPYERHKLAFGDYSAKVTTDSGEEISLCNRYVIERKMNLDELCACFGRERKRFEREFLRARENGARICLMIENASWEAAYAGKYRSKMSAKSLISSMTAWMQRYDCQIIMCREETSGKLIAELLYRAMKEHLTEDE